MINMPHEGGLQFISTMFGTAAKETGFTVYLLVGTTAPTFSDDDSASAFDMIKLGDYPAILNDLAGEEILPATLQPKILVVNGVPQVEFPEYVGNFAAALDGANAGKNVYGYGILGDTSMACIFRETLTEMFVPGAGKILRFIPTLKVGNTTAALT